MKIEVESVYMEHEGGTKYYQIFQFNPPRESGGKIATMVHYGPIKGATDHQRPVNGGTTEAYPGALLNSKKNDKTKRGYRVLDIEKEGVQFESQWWVDKFGAPNAFKIQKSMFPNGETLAPTPVPETSFVAVKTVDVRPENWGTW
jgi:hypothetical protein